MSILVCSIHVASPWQLLPTAADAWRIHRTTDNGSCNSKRGSNPATYRHGKAEQLTDLVLGPRNPARRGCLRIRGKRGKQARAIALGVENSPRTGNARQKLNTCAKDNNRTTRKTSFSPNDKAGSNGAPCRRAIRTKPLRPLRVKSMLRGRASNASRAPPTTTATDLPWDKRCSTDDARASVQRCNAYSVTPRKEK